ISIRRHGQQGVKIQSLGSSKDSQGNLKNASSAETDAMDMDAFTEGCQTSGVNQSSFSKVFFLPCHEIPFCFNFK
ncbi:hypothetical protein Leryth_027474, partial [Lithospermum erythrorhizon]